MAKGAYNPFYIPSLDALKAQARQEAEAQINAELATVPSDATTTAQSAQTGRDLAGFDNSYVNFLKTLRTSSLADTAPPNLNPVANTAGGVQTDNTTKTAQDAAAASAMAGIGFANNEQAQIGAAGANVAANQSANRRALSDALANLAQQRGVIKAKQVALQQDILHQKKSDAFNAYQAYLANQLSAATAGSTAAFNQGKLDISQQNADTAAQNAATKAAGGGAKPKGPTIAAKQKVLDYIDTKIATKHTGDPTTYHSYTTTILTGSPLSPHSVSVGEFPDGTPPATILQKAKELYPDNADDIHGVVVSGTRVAPGASSNAYTWNQVYNMGWKRLKNIGYSTATAKRLMKQYLHSQHFDPPPPKPVDHVGGPH